MILIFIDLILRLLAIELIIRLFVSIGSGNPVIPSEPVTPHFGFFAMTQQRRA
jgi:hypothetical protein